MSDDEVPAFSQLSDSVAAYVRELVMTGQLAPGEAVKPEFVARELGISTTPIREALQALRVEGFLELIPRRGFIVAPLSGDDVRDLFAAHALLAGELAALAAVRATDSDLAELDALQHELLAAAHRQDFPTMEERNHAFHRKVNLIADARRIAGIVAITSRYVPRLFYSSIDGWPKATEDDHASVLRAIRNRDPESARAAMAAHIRHSGELLAGQFDRREHGVGRRGR
jgi:DNA-binding GntR family transcriptional regulator